MYIPKCKLLLCIQRKEGSLSKGLQNVYIACTGFYVTCQFDDYTLYKEVAGMSPRHGSHRFFQNDIIQNLEDGRAME